MRVRPANLLVLGLSVLALAACGAERRGGSNVNTAGGGGGGGGNPGGADDADARPDEALYVEGDTNASELRAGVEDIQSITTEGNRATLQVGPDVLRDDIEITITAQPIGQFDGSDDVINGVYEFAPVDLELDGSVTIYLPLNDLPITKSEQLKLVRWSDSTNRWNALDVSVAVLPGERPMGQAEVDELGVYGLRVVGGFGSLVFDGGDVEDDAQVVDGVECPGSRDDFSIGPQLGQRFPDVNMRNADGVGESLYNLCGNKAILLVSSAFWCGSCRAEFQHLLNLAPTWRERGGAIYYTMFENDARQPPSDAELAAWENDATPEGGERLFRVLKDPRMISALYREVYGALPFNAILDEQMVVKWFKPGAALDEVITEMEQLMD